MVYWTLQAGRIATCEFDLQYPDEFHATLTESGERKIQSKSVKADLNPGEDYVVKASAPAHANWIPLDDNTFTQRWTQLGALPKQYTLRSKFSALSKAPAG